MLHLVNTPSLHLSVADRPQFLEHLLHQLSLGFDQQALVWLVIWSRVTSARQLSSLQEALFLLWATTLSHPAHSSCRSCHGRDQATGLCYTYPSGRLTYVTPIWNQDCPPVPMFQNLLHRQLRSLVLSTPHWSVLLRGPFHFERRLRLAELRRWGQRHHSLQRLPQLLSILQQLALQ